MQVEQWTRVVEGVSSEVEVETSLTPALLEALLLSSPHHLLEASTGHSPGASNPPSPRTLVCGRPSPMTHVHRPAIIASS